jgi:hypothetical protein
MTTPGSIYDRTSADLQLTADGAANAAGAAELQQLGPVRFQISEFTDEGDIQRFLRPAAKRCAAESLY